MMRKLGKLWLWIVYAFLFLPIFVVIAYSFNAAKYTSAWKGFTLKWYSQLFGNAHHEAAHDDGEQLLRAGAAQLLLDGGEGHHVDGEPPGPGGEQAGQLQHFLLGLERGVGIGEEVDHVQGHPPLCDHPTGHRGVDAPGEQRDGPAVDAHRQAAGAGLGLGRKRRSPSLPRRR